MLCFGGDRSGSHGMTRAGEWRRKQVCMVIDCCVVVVLRWECMNECFMCLCFVDSVKGSQMIYMFLEIWIKV